MIDEHVLDELDSSTQGMNPNAVEFLGLRPYKSIAGDVIIKKAATKNESGCVRRVIFPFWLSKWMASTKANQRVGMKPQFRQTKNIEDEIFSYIQWT